MCQYFDTRNIKKKNIKKSLALTTLQNIGNMVFTRRKKRQMQRHSSLYAKKEKTTLHKICKNELFNY